MATAQSTKPLTDTAVKNLKPGHTVKEIADPSSPGLRLRVTPGGKKAWFYRFRDPVSNKLQKVTLGYYPELKLAAARTTWSELAGVRRKRQNPKATLAAQAKARHAEEAKALAEVEDDLFTVKRLVTLYANAISSEQGADYKKSWKPRKHILDRKLVDPYSTLPARTLARGDVRGILDGLRSEGKMVMANRTLASIRALYNWAIDNEHPRSNPITANPCARLKVTSENSRQRALNDPELKTLLTRLPKSDVLTDQEKDVLALALATGARIGEVCSMHHEEIFDDNEWRIPAGKTKNGKVHTVFLSTLARSIVKRQKTDDYVFPNAKVKSKHVRLDTVEAHLREALPALKVEKFTPHDLRRSMSTWLGQEQVDNRIIDRMLNHQPKNLEKTYNVSQYAKPAAQWWQSWGTHLESMLADNVVQLKRAT